MAYRWTIQHCLLQHSLLQANWRLKQLHKNSCKFNDFWLISQYDFKDMLLKWNTQFVWGAIDSMNIYESSGCMCDAYHLSIFFLVWLALPLDCGILDQWLEWKNAQWRKVNPTTTCKSMSWAQLDGSWHQPVRQVCIRWHVVEQLLVSTSVHIWCSFFGAYEVWMVVHLLVFSFLNIWWTLRCS